MNKYRDKSDFDINKAVFHAAKIKHKWFRFSPHGVVTYNIKRDWVTFDPCNNPTDAMPIIKDNLISLEHDGIAWRVSCVRHPEISVWDGCENYNDNFYRKAMELFLLMKDAENES
ncbi:phage protein NinX family protein [Morganella morganii]|uniref:phage protein NinX family protein n=1 Tax=Morganella morganii TaxID=582 RepID=UPI000F846312|nr:phage protein NinX family protein [Morganella morganii]RTY31596.1 DUF2591 domain-containing protein [Morganella morganii subsp. morganii]